MILRVLHVLAVALWFGAGVFFTFVVGLSLFATFERLSARPPDQRPLWLPSAPPLESERPSPAFPEPLRKEQGSRVAGAAVGPMFFPYYALQMGCGVVSLLTALTWIGRGGAHRARVIVLLLALVGAGGGWWLEREVEARRVVRSETSDAVLRGETGRLSEAEAARSDFGRWHTYSLFANFGTLAFVTIAMALAANLPPCRER